MLDKEEIAACESRMRKIIKHEPPFEYYHGINSTEIVLIGLCLVSLLQILSGEEPVQDPSLEPTSSESR